MGCGASTTEDNAHASQQVQPALITHHQPQPSPAKLSPDPKDKQLKKSPSLTKSPALNKSSSMKGSGVRNSQAELNSRPSTKSLAKEEKGRAMSTTKGSNMSQSSSQKNNNKISPSKVRLDIHKEVR